MGCCVLGLTSKVIALICMFFSFDFRMLKISVTVFSAIIQVTLFKLGRNSISNDL